MGDKGLPCGTRQYFAKLAWKGLQSQVGVEEMLNVWYRGVARELEGFVSQSIGERRLVDRESLVDGKELLGFGGTSMSESCESF